MRPEKENKIELHALKLSDRGTYSCTVMCEEFGIEGIKAEVFSMNVQGEFSACSPLCSVILSSVHVVVYGSYQLFNFYLLCDGTQAFKHELKYHTIAFSPMP